MMSAKPLDRIGDLRGTRYDFPCIGDEIAMHVHADEGNHVTIVANGTVRIYGNDYSIERSAPAMVAHGVGVPHAIMGLTEGACVYNIQTKMGADPYLPDTETT